MRVFSKYLIGASILSLACAVPALAQDITPGDTSATKNAQVPATVPNPTAAVQSQPLGSEPMSANATAAVETSPGDIIVTANRTQSLASKTPVALTAISGQGLRDTGVTNPTTLGELVPNLSIVRGDGLQITIRGITSQDGTEKGDPSAAFLVDGIYIARPQAQEVSFFDIERVEVLRGPQGTLYGRNTTAGVVHLITTRPKDRFEASVDGTYGNYGLYQVNGMVNVPVTDWLVVRAAISEDRRNSYIRGDGGRIDPFKQNLSGRLSVLITPNDRISLLVRGDYAAIRGNNTNAVPLSNFYANVVPPAADAYGTDPTYLRGKADRQLQLGYTPNVEDFRRNKSYGIMADFQWAIADRLSLTYLGSYRKLVRDEIFPFPFGFLPGTTQPVLIPFVIPNSYQQDSQEVRLAYDGGPLTVQTGFYYAHENQNIYPQLVGLISPVPGTPGYVFGFPQNAQSHAYAGFGQATYAVVPALRLTGGLRYTYEKKERVGAVVVHTALDQPINFATDTLNNAKLIGKKLTWRAGVDYDLAATTLLYGTVSTGFKSGSFNDGCSAGQANCTSPLPDEALYYKPETLTAYEVGVKARLLDNQVRVNANYFHYEYRDLQLSQLSNICGGPCTVTTNAAKAKVDGVEIESTITPTSRNRFDLSMSWLNARYADYPVLPTVNLAGKRLDRSPEWVVTAGYTYTYPLASGATIGGGIRTRLNDEYFLYSNVLRAQFRQPTYTQTDLTLTYTAAENRYFVQGFAKNLENNIVVTGAGVAPGFPGLSGGTVSFQDPRTYGVRAGIRF